MNVLVTGGAGYIGSHATKALARAGHLPVTFDNLQRGHRENVKWGPLVEADLADESAIIKALKQYEITDVMHFAAYAYVGESMQHPRMYFTNNFCNTLNLLNAMHEVQVKRIVFSSTCATYGSLVSLPIREDHPQRPVNPYGESKLFIEKMLRWAGECEKLDWVALRYFNAAGADPDGETGEDHDPEPHVIPRALAAANGGEPLGVFGTDYPTRDGTAVRDYVHVTDIADAHVRALAYLQNGGASTALNLGTGKGHTVFELIHAVDSELGVKTPYRLEGRREGDPPELVADPSLARETLGWECHHSDLKTIVRTAWAYYKRNVGHRGH